MRHFKDIKFSKNDILKKKKFFKKKTEIKHLRFKKNEVCRLLPLSRTPSTWRRWLWLPPALAGQQARLAWLAGWLGWVGWAEG